MVLFLLWSSRVRTLCSSVVSRDGEDNQECVRFRRREETKKSPLRCFRCCLSSSRELRGFLRWFFSSRRASKTRRRFFRFRSAIASRRFVFLFLSLSNISAFSLSLSRMHERGTVCCIGAGYVGGPTMAMIALKCPHIEVESRRLRSHHPFRDSFPKRECASKISVRTTARLAPFVRFFRRHRCAEKRAKRKMNRPRVRKDERWTGVEVFCRRLSSRVSLSLFHAM